MKKRQLVNLGIPSGAALKAAMRACGEAANAGKNKRHRLAKYVQWLDAKGRPWYQPDLEVGKTVRKAVVTDNSPGLKA